MARSLPQASVADWTSALGRLWVGKNLRVDEPVGKVTAELSIEPVHPLVDAGALADFLWVGRGLDLVGEVLEDRRALGQPESVVFENGDEVARIDRFEGLLEMLPGEQIDDL